MHSERYPRLVNDQNHNLSQSVHHVSFSIPSVIFLLRSTWRVLAVLDCYLHCLGAQEVTLHRYKLHAGTIILLPYFLVIGDW